jgi:hypothetical protein
MFFFTTKDPNMNTVRLVALLLLGIFLTQLAHSQTSQPADTIITNMTEQFLQTPKQAARISINTTNARRSDTTTKKFGIYLSANDNGGDVTLRRNPHKEGLFFSIKNGDFVNALYWNPTLPGSVSRISLESQNELFSGTAFSYEDIKQMILTRENLDRFTYSLESSTDSTWIIRANPKDTDYSQYAYRIMNIRQSDYALKKIRGFVDGNIRRRTEFSKFRTSNAGTPQPRMIIGRYHRGTRVVVSSRMRLNYNKEFPGTDVFSTEFIIGQ